MTSVPWLATYIALWLLMGFMAIAILALARQIGLLNRRIPPAGARMGNSGPQIGQPVDVVNGLDFRGQVVRVGGQNPRWQLLVTLSAECPSCRELAPALRSLDRSDGRNLDILLVTGDSHPEALKRLTTHLNLGSMRAFASPELVKLYRLSATPYALLIDETGILRAKGLVNRLEHLESLLNAAEAGYPSLESSMASRAILVGSRNSNSQPSFNAEVVKDASSRDDRTRPN